MPLARALRETSHSEKELTTPLNYLTAIVHPALHHFVCMLKQELSTKHKLPEKKQHLRMFVEAKILESEISQGRYK